MNIPVLMNPKCDGFSRVNESVETVNRLQKPFRLKVCKANWLPSDPRVPVGADRLRKLVERRCENLPAIVVIGSRFRDDYFSHDYRHTNIVTIYDWEKSFAPPPLAVYLAYQFAQAILLFAVDLPRPLIKKSYHEPPRGCVFDFCDRKKTIKYGMVGANLCGDCEVMLSAMGLSDQNREAVEQILAYVRYATIRRPRTIPTHVFIGHGRSEAWRELEAFLTEELGLQVEEFDQEAPAGKTTIERLHEMLNRTCFAFLVMTGEDQHSDGKKHARENVVHEIGLFQGKLGFGKAIVLRERRCAEFSNIYGLTHIPFLKGKFGLVKNAIRRMLEREGIIEPTGIDPFWLQMESWQRYTSVGPLPARMGPLCGEVFELDEEPKESSWSRFERRLSLYHKTLQKAPAEKKNWELALAFSIVCGINDAAKTAGVNVFISSYIIEEVEALRSLLKGSLN